MQTKPKRTVLVTGGAGFIGSHTVEELLDRGWKVRVLDNLSTGKTDNLAINDPALDLVETDVTCAGSVASAMRGVDACLHLAAQVSVAASLEDPPRSASENILGFVNVLEAARANGVRRVVCASSAAVYGEPSDLPLTEEAALRPTSPYGLEKVVNEQYAALYGRLYGMVVMALRYFNVYGPRQDPASPYAGVISRFVERMSHGETVSIFGDGRQTRDFVYVKDVARANVAALEYGGDGVLNVASGREVNLLSLAELIGEILGTEPRLEFLPERTGDIRHSCGAPTRIHEALSIRADRSLRSGLEALVTSLNERER
ncbi:MAG TPA: NAD-dependent epimerase/dehydratase family protein [Gammaproteobacteria bacterium]|nr:NAD-dependent epimerase/dehydratase family protein [Gammaproteobacteria bacterium]